MTRPRNKQIDDPQVRFTEYLDFYSGNITDPIWELTGAAYTSFTNATVTGTSGGTAEDAPAALVGFTPEPFTGIAYDSEIEVKMPNMNGGNPVTVKFVAADFTTDGGVPILTAARAAARINADLTAHGVTNAAARSVEGKLQILSYDPGHGAPSYGSWAYVTITDVTAGVISKLGFGSNTTLTAYGEDAPVEGVVTKSADMMGGHLALKYDNGSPAVTRVTALRYLGVHSNVAVYFPDVVPGQQIFARLTHRTDATAVPRWVLWFLTHGFREVIRTEGADFPSLGATDTLRIECNLDVGPYLTLDVNFAASPTDVTDAVNAINTQWNSQTSGAMAGTVISRYPEPYAIDSDDDLYFEFDGGGTIQVPFQDKTVSALDVVNRINAMIGASGVAYVVTLNGKSHVAVRTATYNGETSTLDVTEGTNGPSALEKLGLSTGRYTGSQIAFVDGSELILRSPEPGDSSQISVTDLIGTPTTKMAFVGTSSNLPTEEAVTPSNPASVISLFPDPVYLIPEMMDFGDVPDDVEVHPTNHLERATVVNEATSAVERGGLPSLPDMFGTLPPQLLNAIRSFLAVDTLQVGGRGVRDSTPRFSVPHRKSTVGGNYMLLFASKADGAYATIRAYAETIIAPLTNTRSDVWITFNARWDGIVTGWTQDDASQHSFAIRLIGGGTNLAPPSETNSSVTVYWKAYNSGSFTSWDETPFMVTSEDLGSRGAQIQIDGAVLTDPSNPLGLSDVNVSGTSPEVIPLSGGTATNGDARLRLLERDALSVIGSDYSLIRDVNARFYITVGNGSETFGDFNGATGLEDAITFAQATTLGVGTIVVKPGTYTASATLAINGGDYTIVAAENDYKPIIQAPPSGPTIYLDSATEMILDGIRIQSSDNNYAIHSDNAKLRAVDCIIEGAFFENNDERAVFERCTLNATTGTSPHGLAFHITGSSTGADFLDCFFSCSGTGKRCVFVEHRNGAIYHLDRLVFERCVFNLGTTVNSSGNLATNTGLIDFNPGTDDIRAGNGTLVNEIRYKDCEVRAYGSDTNILLHLIPTANGVTAAASPSPFMYAKLLRFVRTRFLCTISTDLYNPFTCAFGAETIEIQDCEVKLTASGAGGSHGYPTADLAYAWSSSLPTNGEWGLIAISAPYITIKGLVGTDIFQYAGSGFMAVRYNKLHIDGIKVKSWNQTALAGSTTLQAWTNFTCVNANAMRPGSSASAAEGSVSNVEFIGAISTAQWGHSFFNIKSENTIFRNLRVANFSVSGSQPSADGVRITSVADKIRLEYSHFEFLDKGIYGGGSDSVGGFVIRNNYVSDCDNFGIEASWLNLTDEGFDISNNTVTRCTSTVGIYILFTQNASSGFSIPMHVCDNRVYGNNTGDPNLVQIQFAPAFGAGETFVPIIVAYGNICGLLPGSGTGRIEWHRVASGVLTSIAGTTSSRATAPWYGLETGHSTTSAVQYEFNVNPLIHNVALLYSP